MKTVEEILVNVFNIDPARINDAASPENVEEWDSFNGLLLVTELEKEFNVEFSIDEVVAVRNVGDIKETLRKHGVDL